ncbi:MAG: hypothetical protein IE890_00875 [Arcobacter sp.]|nr:hypothetical protein [Arcobacter sp.]
MNGIKDIDQNNIVPIKTAGWGANLYFSQGSENETPATASTSTGMNTNTLLLIGGAILIVFLLMKK